MNHYIFANGLPFDEFDQFSFSECYNETSTEYTSQPLFEETISNCRAKQQIIELGDTDSVDRYKVLISDSYVDVIPEGAVYEGAYVGALPPLRLFCSYREIEKRYGQTIVRYFSFMNFLLLTNLFIFLFALCNFIPHCFIKQTVDATPDDDDDDSLVTFMLNSFSNFKRFFYVSTYSVNSFYSWFCSVAFVAAFTFLVPLIYHRVCVITRRRPSYREDRNREGEIIAENKHIRRKAFLFQFGLSYVIFFVTIVAILAAIWALTLLQYNLAGSTIFSLIISLFITIIGVLFSFFASFLTDLEKHRTVAYAKVSYLFKMMSYRELTFFMMLFSKWHIFVNQGENLNFHWSIPKTFFDSSEKDLETHLESLACGVDDTADQVLIFMFTELFVGNFIEIFMPTIVAFFKQHVLKMNNVKSIDYYGDFDIANEYLELVYRQFILYISFPFFPMCSAICALINALEIVIDRLRLFRFCKTPQRLNTNISSIVIVNLLVTSFLAFLAFPRGSIFTLIGVSYKDHCPNTVFSHSFY